MKTHNNTNTRGKARGRRRKEKNSKLLHFSPVSPSHFPFLVDSDSAGKYVYSIKNSRNRFFKIELKNLYNQSTSFNNLEEKNIYQLTTHAYIFSGNSYTHLVIPCHSGATADTHRCHFYKKNIKDWA